jgi:hypothetical protein
MTLGVNAIIESLHRDREWLAGQGIHLTQYGPDPESGKVKVYLARYSENARQVLTERYGSDVVISTESRSWSFGEGGRQ